MGGSILFTQSATFSPSAYGLTTGKFINYIIIGGGGAGGSFGRYDGLVHSSGTCNNITLLLNSGGSNGGTSSIGSYVSALGGSTPTTTSSEEGVKSLMPLIVFPTGSTSNTYAKRTYGGFGAGGWIPGRVFNAYQKGGDGFYTSTNTNLPDYVSVYDHGGQKVAIIDTSSYADGGYAAVTYPASNVTSGNAQVGGACNPYNLIQNTGTPWQGSDGIGYGAGGGGCGYGYDGWYEGCVASSGGNSGQFKQGSFKLTSTSDIAITVGAGGTPHTKFVVGGSVTGIGAAESTTSQRYWQRGRIGTHGAVMLFWD